MFVPWKLFSFWLGVIAWLCAGGAVIMFFATLAESWAEALVYLLSGGVAFVFWQSLSIITKAAEQSLGIEHVEQEAEEEQEEA